jgi:hypothetical protein
MLILYIAEDQGNLSEPFQNVSSHTTHNYTTSWCFGSLSCSQDFPYFGLWHRRKQLKFSPVGSVTCWLLVLIYKPCWWKLRIELYNRASKMVPLLIGCADIIHSGAAESVLVINSFSKYHCMTGWRIGGGSSENHHQQLGFVATQHVSDILWQSAKDHITTSTTSRLTTSRLSRLYDF